MLYVHIIDLKHLSNATNHRSSRSVGGEIFLSKAEH